MSHPPLKEGATIHHLPVARCALPGASCGQQIIFALLQSSQGTLHFPCAGVASYPFVDLSPGITLYYKLFPFAKFSEIRLYFFNGIAYNEAINKLRFV